MKIRKEFNDRKKYQKMSDKTNNMIIRTKASNRKQLNDGDAEYWK